MTKKLAKLKYFPNNFQIIEVGDYVLCAVSKQQININQIICSSYAKNMNLEADNINICELGKKIVDGVNKQEVVIIPKKLERTGFFERLFHLFN